MTEKRRFDAVHKAPRSWAHDQRTQQAAETAHYVHNRAAGKVDHATAQQRTHVLGRQPAFGVPHLLGRASKNRVKTYNSQGAVTGRSRDTQVGLLLAVNLDAHHLSSHTPHIQ